MTMQSPRNDAFGGGANGGMGAAYGSAPTGKQVHKSQPCHTTVARHQSPHEHVCIVHLLLDVSQMWWCVALWHGYLLWPCGYT